MNATKNTLVEVMEFHGNRIAFEEINGKMMVNATQMAKPFGKRTSDWLKTQQAKDLVEAMTRVKKVVLTDLQVVRNGGYNPGIWLDEDIALLFAQWLSPDFYIACNFKLKELLAQKTLIAPIKHNVPGQILDGEILFPYNLACNILGNVKYPRAGKRRERHPQHFRKIFGKVFITESYLDLLNGYYGYKKASNQLSLTL